MERPLYEIRMEYWQEAYKRWVTEEIFTFPWFFNIAFLITLYVVWVKIVDKKRLRELLLFGSLLAVASVLVDLIAVTIGLWEYRVSLIPVSPAPFPFDLTVVPIFYMIVLQYTSSWKQYLIGALIAGAIFSFIIIPIYVWLGIKVFHNFTLFYMFVVVIVVTVAIKAVFNWIVSIEMKNVSKKI